MTTTASPAVAVLPAPLQGYALGLERSPARRQARDLILGFLSEQYDDLREHTARVADLAGPVASRLGLSADERADVVRAAELHDIGKVGVPQQVLQKAGPLADSEWEIVRQHTIVGEQMLSAVPGLHNVARLVRSSHERWDGFGYPDGLVGEMIPLGSRVVFACDAFDAMTAARPWLRWRNDPA